MSATKILCKRKRAIGTYRKISQIQSRSHEWLQRRPTIEWNFKRALEIEYLYYFYSNITRRAIYV